MNFLGKIKSNTLSVSNIIKRIRKISTVSEPISANKHSSFKYYNYEKVLQDINSLDKTSSVSPFELYSSRINLMLSDKKKKDEAVKNPGIKSITCEFISMLYIT